MAEGTCNQCQATVTEDQTNCPGCGAVLSAADFPIDPDDEFLKRPPSPPPASAPPPIEDVPPPPSPPQEAGDELGFSDDEPEPPPMPSPPDPEPPPSLGDPEDYTPPPPASTEDSSKSKVVIIAVALVVVLLLGLVGVKFLLPMLTDGDKPKPTIVAKKPAPAPAPAPVEKPKPKPEPVTMPAPKPAPTAGDMEMVESAMADWEKAWAEKDFKAYRAMYARNFRGIKRTIAPKTYRYSYSGWMRDRRGMLKTAEWTKVEVSDLEIVKTTKREIKVKFTQKYTSDTYNDIGPKTITFVKRKGALKIKYEEMLEANPL